MSIEFHVVIPARYHSSRLPAKVLCQLQGMTMLERVYRQALAAFPASIVIATDHEEIYTTAKNFGAQVLMTDTKHQTGSDRIAQAVETLGLSEDAIVVNVQGDEPLIPPKLIQQVATSLAHSDASMATLCWPIQSLEEAQNPNVVKVVRDIENYALYFSRSSIPFHRENLEKIDNLYRHIGIYAYRADFLLKFVKMPASPLEQVESLEQLRALWNGKKIKVETACVPPRQDVNTQMDLHRVEKLLSLELM